MLPRVWRCGQEGGCDGGQGVWLQRAKVHGTDSVNEEKFYYLPAGK